MAKRRGHNEGSIYQSKGKWQAQVTVEGRRLSKTFGTQRECREWIRETLNQVAEGLTVNGAKTTVAAFLAQWIEAEKGTIRPRSWDLYERAIRLYIVPHLGKLKIGELQPGHVQALYSSVLKEVAARKERKGQATGPYTGVRTVQQIHIVLHKSMAQALEWGLIRRNPCDGVK